MTDSREKKYLQSPHSPLSVAIFLGLLNPISALAHPVVFANGTAVMGHHQGEMAELEIVHSPTPKLGLGLSFDRMPQELSVLGKASALLWRGNYPDYQSNIYLSLAAGRRWAAGRPESEGHSSSNTKGNASSPLYQWSAGWDGEDRLIYSMLKYAQNYSNDGLSKQQGTLRLGFAPYKAQNDELTVWGIMEWLPEKSENQMQWTHNVTPLVRLFYKNALLEIGSSFSGKVTFNYMFHFFN
ncbi:hypothetical protein EBU99_12065 [bacterium]|nr:hypothetical protein [bacterium]